MLAAIHTGTSAEIAVEADIMVVDDHPPNVMLLEEMLRRKGHRVRSFMRGLDALEAAREQPPDLMLLDINMPGLNGYEVCKQVKNDPRLAGTPVIFLSALSHTADKVEAFRAGGLDYISKPFEFEEVHARVETHLKLHRLQEALHHQNRHLDAIVQSRTRDLEAANRRLAMLDRAKSEFLRMISHELRTPLNGLLGAADLVLTELESAAGGKELGAIFGESKQRILALVDSALLLTQIEIEGGKFRTDPVCLRDVLTRASRSAAQLALARNVRIEMPQTEMGRTRGDRDLLVRTVVKFCTPGDTVLVTAANTADTVTVAIETRTGAIPDAALARFFELFGINESSTRAGDLGLDPAIAGRIVSLFGGSLAAANLQPAGIRLEVHFPDAEGPRCA
jgi:two-component system sensor histidine kinase/response regulator